jgi:hypothetical protein
MRNPDPWLPDQPKKPQLPDSRRSALVGLAVIALLLIGGWVLTHVLGTLGKQQDCALEGRGDCTPELEKANGH